MENVWKIYIFDVRVARVKIRAHNCCTCILILYFHLQCHSVLCSFLDCHSHTFGIY